MKFQEMLHVEWNDKESATYYIDRDKFSKAHRRSENMIELLTHEGTYTFGSFSGTVELYDGTQSKHIDVKSWRVYYDLDSLLGRQVKAAISNLGEKATIRISGAGLNRYWVELDEKFFGIYDISRNTFVD